MAAPRPIGILGMPCRGQMHPHAARGLFWANQADDVEWVIEVVTGSVAVHNMNQILCVALNACLAGRKVEYLAYQHDDVGPQKQWLDIAVAEQRRTGLDVLSVVVPIKDPRGLSSVAVACDDLREKWRVQYRLSMTEIHQLPETFTQADLPREKGPLLVNNGCLLIKFRPEWADPVGPYGGPVFRDDFRIRYASVSKSFVADFSPEDWDLSRQFHRMGLTVGATRKIALTHEGEKSYPNYLPWGTEKQDEESRTEAA